MCVQQHHTKQTTNLIPSRSSPASHTNTALRTRGELRRPARERDRANCVCAREKEMKSIRVKEKERRAEREKEFKGSGTVLNTAYSAGCAGFCFEPAVRPSKQSARQTTERVRHERTQCARVRIQLQGKQASKQATHSALSLGKPCSRKVNSSDNKPGRNGRRWSCLLLSLREVKAVVLCVS